MERAVEGMVSEEVRSAGSGRFGLGGVSVPCRRSRSRPRLPGGSFLAISVDCAQPNGAKEILLTPTYIEEVHEGAIKVGIERASLVYVEITLKRPGTVTLQLKDTFGNMTTLVPPTAYDKAGTYRKYLTFKKVKPAVYQLCIKTQDDHQESQVVVLE